MKQRKPKFDDMRHHFNRVHVSVQKVGEIIGGKVEQNIALEQARPGEGFANACTIRLCYCLHQSGAVIGKGEWKTVTGADKKSYIYRVNDFRRFLETSFGKPNKAVQNAAPRDFVSMKGIIIFTRQWGNASGHATLWDGSQCADACYFPDSSKAEIWQLK